VVAPAHSPRRGGGLLAAASVAVIVTRDGASPARDESSVRVVFHGDHTDADSATLRTFADSLTAHRPGSPGARPGWLLRLARSLEADLRGEPAPCVAAEGCLRVGPEVARQTVALDDAAAELRTTLVAGAAPLPPDARASLERSLRVVDTAIAEARAELARDPANAAVASALAAGQERRVELLRQAARLLVEI
jgi:hypothetical protein